MPKLVFFGTPQFAATVLDYLLAQGADVAAVVTKPDKPKGRSKTPVPPPVKTLALEHGLPVHQPKKASDPEFADQILAPLEADLFIVVAYSEILKENLLKMPRLGCVNVHASLLPKYRGAAPIQRAVMNGDPETGVTIMSMEPELDAGEILAVEKLPISQTMTSGDVMEALSHKGAHALWEVIQKFASGNVERTPQDPTQVTYAKKLTSEDGKIDWTQPAQVVHNQIRGVTPKPGAWCQIADRGRPKRLRIQKTLPEPGLSGEPGALLDVPGCVVACGEGALRLLEVQPEGKRPMEAEAFLRGVDRASLSFMG